MKFKDWKPPNRIEQAYKKAITSQYQSLAGFMLPEMLPDEIANVIKKLVETKEFYDLSRKAAMTMVTSLLKDNGHNWREAARINARGREVYELLQKEFQGGIGKDMQLIVAANAQYISSAPLEIAENITDYAAKAYMSGQRSEDIAQYIFNELPGALTSRARLIARTETSKASTALVRTRAEELDIRGYVWRTSDDVRVRSSHDHMDDVIVFWDSPPSPESLIGERNYGTYHAGETFNCRCYPEPLVDLDYVSWPHKVYYQGQIKYMTRANFLKLIA